MSCTEFSNLKHIEKLGSKGNSDSTKEIREPLNGTPLFKSLFGHTSNLAVQEPDMSLLIVLDSIIRSFKRVHKNSGKILSYLLYFLLHRMYSSSE